MKCFYHSADLDGHCSGAIVKRAHPECEMIGINYGDPFPWDTIERGEEVFMVDFCLQPFEDMVRLNNLCRLLWYDHHKSAIEELRKHNPGRLLCGIRDEKLAGCEICWNAFFPKDPMPWAVYLLGRYDVWDLEVNVDVLPFQWGMRLNEETRPEKAMALWDLAFENDNVGPVVRDGQLILAYQKAQNTKYARSHAFESTFEGHPVIVINRGLTNSQLFDSVWDPEKHKMMVTFVWRKGQWHVSLYTTHDDVDVSVYAKKHGGGGHKGAAGFQCKEFDLPFEIVETK